MVGVDVGVCVVRSVPYLVCEDLLRQSKQRRVRDFGLEQEATVLDRVAHALEVNLQKECPYSTARTEQKGPCASSFPLLWPGID